MLRIILAGAACRDVRSDRHPSVDGLDGLAQKQRQLAWHPASAGNQERSGEGPERRDATRLIEHGQKRSPVPSVPLHTLFFQRRTVAQLVHYEDRDSRPAALGFDQCRGAPVNKLIPELPAVSPALLAKRARL